MQKSGMCMSKRFVNIETLWIQSWKRERKTQSRRPNYRASCFCPAIFLFPGTWGNFRTSATTMRIARGPRSWTQTSSSWTKTKPTNWKRASKIDISPKIFAFVTVWTKVARISVTKRSRTSSRVASQNSSRGDQTNESLSCCSLLDSQFHSPRDFVWLLSPGTDNGDFNSRPSPWVSSSGRAGVYETEEKSVCAGATPRVLRLCRLHFFSCFCGKGVQSGHLRDER